MAIDSATTQTGLTIIRRSLLRTTSKDWDKPEDLFRQLQGTALREILGEANRVRGGAAGYEGRRALLMFDCMLRVIEEPEISSILQLGTTRFGELQDIFYGALASRKFCNLAPSTRIVLAHAFFRLFRNLRQSYEICPSSFTPNSNKYLPDELSAAFDVLPLNVEALENLTPFILTANDGTAYNVLLKPLSSHAGRAFTQRFHSGLCAIAKSKAKDALLRDFGTTFANFVATQSNSENPINEPKLNNGDFVQAMLVDLMEYHFLKMARMESSAQEGTLGSLQKVWSHYMGYWKILVTKKIVAAPTYSYPMGNPKLRANKEVRHQRTASAEDGSTEIVTHKLITPVPLHLSDEEATNLIFGQIKDDLEITQDWLNSHLENLWSNYQRGNAIAEALPTLSENNIKVIGAFNPRTNPDALANAVRYFKEGHQGFADTNRVSTAAFPTTAAREGVSKTKLSSLLGIPSREDAMAMMGYLASIDGRFSESALSTSQLYNREGKRFNAVANENDSLTLSVYKKRAGESGWEHIVLSGRAYMLVQRWIELTTSTREYMKRNKIDGWRNLIVYVGAPMGKPAFFKSVSNVNSGFRVFAQRGFMQLGDLSDIVTISRIRAQRGMMVFLEKFDVKAMARELGNDEETSMRHYLPDAIWNYLAVRWIRIFQNLMIVEATKDTPYMQRALSFENATELDEFLKNHATKPLIPYDSKDIPAAEHIKGDTALTEVDAARPIQEVVVAASVGIFSTLLSVKEAVKLALDCGDQVHARALYWYEFMIRLQSHIESDTFKDRAIKKLLKDAAQTASSAEYSKAIRA